MRRLMATLALSTILGGCAAAHPTAVGHVVRHGTQHRARTGPKPVAMAAVQAPAHTYYQNEVVVLMYHGLGPTAHGDVITAGAFAGEMAVLRQDGFHFVSLSQVASFLQGGEVPPNAVAVTFDDGLESVYTYAYPTLVRDRIPFAGFLIAGRIGRYMGTLSWTQVNAMVRSGLFTVGSHTLSSHDAVPTGPHTSGPALVDRIYNPATGQTETDAQYRLRVGTDLQRARDVLRLETGQPVQWFAYPFGAYDPEVEQILAQDGYRYGVIAEWGWGVTRFARPLVLPRINVGTPKTTPSNIAQTVEWIAGLTEKDVKAQPPLADVPSW